MNDTLTTANDNFTTLTFEATGADLSRGFKTAQVATDGTSWAGAIYGHVWFAATAGEQGTIAFSGTDRYIYAAAQTTHKIDGPEGATVGIAIAGRVVVQLLRMFASRLKYRVTLESRTVDGVDHPLARLTVTSLDEPMTITYAPDASQPKYPKLSHLLLNVTNSAESKRGPYVRYGTEPLTKLNRMATLIGATNIVLDNPTEKHARFTTSDSTRGWRLFGVFMPQQPTELDIETMDTFDKLVNPELLPGPVPQKEKETQA